MLRARDALVSVRTEVINTTRGLVKSMGTRLPGCSSPSFAEKVKDAIPVEVGEALRANARCLRKEAELNAINNGIGVLPENGNGHRSLAAAVTEYLEETKLTKKAKTHAAYSTALAYFKESCHKLFLHEIERRDLLKFSAFLRDEKEQSPRSVYNKFENIMTFLKGQGIRGLVGKNDWPRFTEEEPEIYEQEELEKLFHCL